MKFKFMIAFAIVLSAFMVLPVNATNYNIDVDLTFDGSYFSKSFEIDYGTISENSTVTLHFINYDLDSGNCLINYQNQNIIIGTAQNPPTSYTIELLNSPCEFTVFGAHPLLTPSYQISYTIYFNHGGIVPNDFDIDIDKQEQILELGNIDNLNQQFTIGSSIDRVIKQYQGYQSSNCDIVDLDRHNIEIRFNKDYPNSASVYLFGTAQKEENITDFATTVYFNFTYADLTKIPFEIEFIDYDKGLQVIGTNLTVYYYDESANTLTQTYRNANCNGLERIQVINNSVLFLEYNLNGYNAVNIDTYDFLNNRQGKLIDSNLRSARLYFSKIDPSVLLFQGFIIKDNLGNALSGVSVTMDNNQTVISNQYGGVRFDNINQGVHTFVFSKTGYYSQSLSKSVSVSNTQDILLVSSQPTTAPTVKPTPLQTDSQGNIIIEKPSNLSDSIKYGLAKIFGITSLDSINLIFALILILFPAVIGGTITNQALGFISGGMIGFVFALAVGLIPIWVFFSMVMFAVIYLILTHSNDGF